MVANGSLGYTSPQITSGTSNYGFAGLHNNTNTKRPFQGMKIEKTNLENVVFGTERLCCTDIEMKFDIHANLMDYLLRGTKRIQGKP